MSSSKWVPLLAGASSAAYVTFLAYLWCVQRKMVFRGSPPTRPWGHLSVTRPDGVLHGWVTNPEATAAIVVFGGNAMPVADVGAAWSARTPAAVYMLPYRGFEGQFGFPTEKNLIADGVALVRQVQLTHSPVILVGISLGSGVAAQVAAQTRPDRVVLVTPYDRLDKVAHDQWPLVPTRIIMRDRFDSVTAVQKLAGVPVAIFQADQDKVVRAARTHALAKAIPGGPDAWSHAPTSHSGIWLDPSFSAFIGDQVGRSQALIKNSSSGAHAPKGCIIPPPPSSPQDDLPDAMFL